MSNRNKQLGSAFENRVVEKANKSGVPSSRQPGSGVFKNYPSDVVMDYTILAECKVRTAQQDASGNQYIRVDTNWKEKVSKEAHEAGFEAGVVVVNAKGSKHPFVIVDLDFFLQLVKYRSDNRDRSDK